MTILDRIRSLANERKVTLAELERNLDFSNGSLRKWDTSTPSGDKIEKVADYFNVSVDYLLGRTKNPYSPNDNLMNTQELQALITFRKETEDMSDDEKERFNIALINMMKNARDLVKDDSFWK
ncbi:helix-turn-helix domain-containing protein [Streptococcus oralis]|jgi:transcriptional regulator with XRE-family HTH domain|uniref:helix-turn-helix domain-containing protein n=1 Tax=Streptococcus oralis TaxID=1303 RepID=UPI00080B65FE|nr:helix-turn-helix transcriptional regulator [Streptococcus oralis]DAO76932.1 MAG TPA: repressor protein [Caudoviricetes sp.]DAQ53702.1 MAG TPA: repressor protein [Caudoviricetes sp.]DAW49728.1 MAG TPA: repressor protein [Caudoviricetes sp.]